MNPAGSDSTPVTQDPVRSAIQAQGHRIHKQEELLGQLRGDLQRMADQQESMIAAFTSQLNMLAERLSPSQANPDSASVSAASSAPPVPPVTAESGWNPTALFDAFLNGLNDHVKDQLAPLDLPETLDELIALAIKIDRRLIEREHEKCRRIPQQYRGPCFSPVQGAANSETPALYPREDEPMQLGCARLTPEEREKRMREGRCYYCGGFGHFSATCSAKARARQ
uniref:CCHC-type domain-containing protein n=1 Tax=Knipowitschia caucasica TaxID=637954 RepID=A0AAV2K7B5_KNICA